MDLSCSIDEWYFSRIYMQIGQAKSVAKDMQREKLKELIKPGLLLLVVILLNAVISNINLHMEEPIETVIRVLVVLTIPGMIIWIFKKIKQYQKYKKMFLNAPNKNDTLLLYRVKDDGIVINYYNVAEYLHSFKWEDIQYAEVKETEYERIYTESKNGRRRLNTGQMQKGVSKDFAEVRERLPAFPYQEKIHHDDKRSISLGMKNSRVNVLPLPKSWEENGMADAFIRIIQEKIGDSFFEEGESWDLLEKLFPRLSKRILKEKQK